jgi:hypothetical protein
MSYITPTAQIPKHVLVLDVWRLHAHDRVRRVMKSAPRKARMEAGIRSLERRIGIDREGRSVWVWLLPPGVGLFAAALVPFMPGLPDAMGLLDRLTLAAFALLTMTAIASIYLISFDNDHNQQAPVDDPPAHGDDGPEHPPAPSGSPPPKWLRDLDAVSPENGDQFDEADTRPRTVPAMTGADRSS